MAPSKLSGVFSASRAKWAPLTLIATVIVALMSACSTIYGDNPAAVERCSTLGTLACATVARISGDGSSTCSVSISRGQRTEICGVVPAVAVDRSIYPVQLNWADNSDNESHFVIERCDGKLDVASCTGAWQQVATVGPNTTTYSDRTAMVNRTYIYRIKAVNSAGSSKYTQEAIISTPAHR